jgi:hypothetical protein
MEPWKFEDRVWIVDSTHFFGLLLVAQLLFRSAPKLDGYTPLAFGSLIVTPNHSGEVSILLKWVLIGRLKPGHM